MAANLKELQDAQARNEVRGTVKNQSPDGRNFPREEIDLFITRADTCNLFLLALQALQDNAVQDQPWSWFGISSIHGLPYGAWQGVTQNTARSNDQYQADMIWKSWDANQNEGYCSHASVLFPSWHRPYLAMIEQAIFLKCAELAETFPDGAIRIRYKEAAKRFRLPYFDPFMPRVLVEPQRGAAPIYRCGVPQILSTRVVNVTVPGWRNSVYVKEIKNPLYSYKFPTVRKSWKTVPKYAFDSNPPFQFTSLWNYNNPQASQRAAKGKLTPNVRTVRRPMVEDGKSNHDDVKNKWAQNMFGVGAKFYALLNDVHTYNQFSNKSFDIDPRTADPPIVGVPKGSGAVSIEGFHDDIHGWLGGSSREPLVGHMRIPSYASYDPVFWLHHCNVDRIFDMWLRLNPTVKPGPREFSQNLAQATFTEPEGFNQTQTTPLLPFYRVKVKFQPYLFWKTADCWDTDNMGYYYIESSMLQPDLRKFINNRYLWLIAGVDPAARKPPSSELTGFPVDFGPKHVNAPCLPRTVFLDGKSTWPSPYLQEFQEIRAVRSVKPEVSGVEQSQQRTVDAIGADSEDLVPRASFAAVINTNSIRQWDVLVQFQKFGAGGAFYVYFFIGKVSGGMTGWEDESSYAGEVFNFANSIDTPCPNCANQAIAETVVADSLGLTPKLMEFLASPTLLHPISLKTLGKEDVIPFLQKHLQWRIVDTNRKVWKPSDLPGFKVMVASRVFHPPPTADVFGTFTDYEPATEVTHDKNGGLQHGEPF